MTLKHPILFCFFAICLSASCSDDKGTSTVYSVTFDELSGYIDNPTIKTLNNAHSGNKCVQLNREYMYGPTFSRKISEIRSGQINRLFVSGWVKIDSEKSKMQIVCSIDSGDKTIFWNSVDSRTASLQPGEWKQISTTFDLSKVNAGDNKLNIYPMHDGEGNSYIDDLEFRFE